ncbi:hypothetical protein SAMD00019534_007250, partial [Acytostelium subglobosum LB1]|uniref:hypothetical protein n=1 Tax=Acytostelium subglobosum LB1 TaxID=1410327 RepID=UPI0006451589
MLPASLTSLTIMGERFQSNLNHVLPESLKMLRINDAFNWNLPIESGGLPSQLERINFGGTFNHPLAGVLPQSINRLKLEYSRFDHDLVNMPSNLTRLSLHCVQPFARRIDLPNLQRLKISQVSQPFTNVFPQLKILSIGKIQTTLLTSHITDQNFPRLYRLHVNNILDQAGQPKTDLNLSRLPTTLRKLRIIFAQPISAFPIGLESLKMEYSGLFRLHPGLLPTTIRTLDIRSYQTQLEEGCIPQSIRSISIDGRHLGQLVGDHVAPLPSLRKLTLKIIYRKSIIKQLATPLIRIVDSEYIEYTLRRISPDIFIYVSFNMTRCGFININNLSTVIGAMDDDS